MHFKQFRYDKYSMGEFQISFTENQMAAYDINIKQYQSNLKLMATHKFGSIFGLGTGIYSSKLYYSFCDQAKISKVLHADICIDGLQCYSTYYKVNFMCLKYGPCTAYL